MELMNGITPVQIFNSEQIEIVKIKYKNKNINQSVYQGNVDKVVSSGYPMVGSNKSDSTTVMWLWFINTNRRK